MSAGSAEIIGNIGGGLAFEEPFWAGDFPATDDDDYMFPFHPLELGEAALDNLFGFVFEGYTDMPGDNGVDPFEVILVGFRVTAPKRKRRFFRRW